MTAAESPDVVLLYSRDDWFLCDDGLPRRGGYYARVAGFVDQGAGRTAEEALAGLAAALRAHAQARDAEADDARPALRGQDRLNRGEEPALIAWVRGALCRGRLLDELTATAPEPVLAEDPLR